MNLVRMKRKKIMADTEKAVAIIFFLAGLFVGSLGGLTVGADLTLREMTLQGSVVCYDN